MRSLLKKGPWTSRWSTFFALAVVAFSGLSPVQADQRPTQGRAAVRAPVQTAGQAQQPPPPPLPPLAVTQLEVQQLKGAEPTFSLSFSEPIPIRDLLLLLVRDTNISVVPDPSVEGPTFIGELKNVTLTQALDLILHPLNLDYTFQDNVIRVFARQLETRIFHINYVATRRSGSRSLGATTGATGAGVTGFGAGVGGGIVGGVGGLAGGQFGQTTGGGGSSASVTGTDSNDLFQEITQGIATVLSGEGRWNLDRKAGILQVSDYPSNLDKVATYIAAYEARVLRQVQIVAQVIEVELRESLSTGIDWGTVFRNAGDSVSITQNLTPSDAGGAFTIGMSIRNITGLLDAFATQGRVNVLSTPRVMAMNNEPAVMRVGTQDVFFTTTSQVDATTGRVLQTTVTPQSITEGVVLSVTPQISGDGIINLSINPSVTERTGQATSRLGDTVPIISVRETDTLVRLREGETIVIAGLMQERSSKEDGKVPGLGDVPVIGGLFRRSDKTKRKTDLVILLTPSLMNFSAIQIESMRQQEKMYEAQKAPPRK